MFFMPINKGKGTDKTQGKPSKKVIYTILKSGFLEPGGNLREVSLESQKGPHRSVSRVERMGGSQTGLERQERRLRVGATPQGIVRSLGGKGSKEG